VETADSRVPDRAIFIHSWVPTLGMTITQITQISRGASFWKNLLERGVLEANNFEEKRQQALAGIVGPNPAKSSV
jgi:hypothetical protein